MKTEKRWSSERERVIMERKLQHVIQRVRSLTFHHIDAVERARRHKRLKELDEMYTKEQISFDEYMFLSLTFLMQDWTAIRREQFLYSEAKIGKLLDSAQRWAIVEFSPQKLQD